MRKGFIFYKSFYDSIKELDPEDQVQIYNAIFNYQFNGEVSELNGVCKSIFTLIIPQLEANNNRYENGCKGGRPKTKTEPKENQTKTKKKPKEKEKEKEKDKDIIYNNIYELVEENFCRLLSPIEYQELSSWEDNELTRYAIKQAVLNGKYNIKYISAIINNYKKNSITTVQQAQNYQDKYKNKKEPEWLNQDIQQDIATDEEINELLKEWK